MKKMLLAAAAASAVLATPAMAADTTYTVAGTVTEACSVANGQTLDFGNNINTGGLNLTATTTNEVDDSAAYCNGSATKLTVGKTDLTNTTATGAAPTGFTKTLTFTPVITIKGVEYNSTTNANVGAFQGMKVKAINVSSGTDKALAGQYTGSISITLTPTV